jgi:hypothetical protein
MTSLTRSGESPVGDPPDTINFFKKEKEKRMDIKLY